MEKKVQKEDKGKLIYSQPITLNKMHYILNIWSGKPAYLEVIYADNAYIVVREDLDEMDIKEGDKIDFF